jgi:phage protein D
VNKKTIIGKSRRGTVFKVQFPTLPSIKTQPTVVLLKQKQKQHDILVIEYHATSFKNARLLKTGVPVKFVWRQGSRKSEWIGYVSSVSAKSASQRDLPMKVYCIGTSFVLKQTKSKTYRNKTVTEVAAAIAKENNLRFVGDIDKRRFSQLSISGHSQWEWLQEQASRIGYVAYVQGTNLIFRSMDKIIDEKTLDAPLFQVWSPYIPQTTQGLDRTLDSFEVMMGENIEGEYPNRAIKQTGGVDPVRGISFSHKKSPSKSGKSVRQNVSDTLFDEYTSDQVVNSKSDSRSAASGAAELARFNIPAKAAGQGDPRVHPYQMIEVQGVDVNTDGHWIVREVTHRLVYGGFYTLEMIVATDGIGKSTRKTKNSTRTIRNANNSSIPFKTAIDVNFLLNKNKGSFNPAANDSSINLEVELNRTGNPAFRGSSKETSSSKLSSKRPLLTGVNNQGYSRTPTLWQSKLPTSKSPRKPNKF